MPSFWYGTKLMLRLKGKQDLVWGQAKPQLKIHCRPSVWDTWISAATFQRGKIPGKRLEDLPAAGIFHVQLQNEWRRMGAVTTAGIQQLEAAGAAGLGQSLQGDGIP